MPGELLLIIIISPPAESASWISRSFERATKGLLLKYPIGTLMNYLKPSGVGNCCPFEANWRPRICMARPICTLTRALGAIWFTHIAMLETTAFFDVSHFFERMDGELPLLKVLKKNPGNNKASADARESHLFCVIAGEIKHDVCFFLQVFTKVNTLTESQQAL